MLPPSLRRLILTIHVLLSVGWAGGVAVFLALALTGFTHGDPEIAGSAYVAMKLATDYVVLPVSVMAPISGLALAFGTRWGLVRHYWVVIKAIMTLPATGLLFLHTGPIDRLAQAAIAGAIPAQAWSTQLQMVVDSALALGVLATAAALGIVKPAGATGLGRRS